MFQHRSLGWESIRYRFAPLCEGLLQCLISPLSAPNHFHELPPGRSRPPLFIPRAKDFQESTHGAPLQRLRRSKYRFELLDVFKAENCKISSDRVVFIRQSSSEFTLKHPLKRSGAGIEPSFLGPQPPLRVALLLL